MGYTINPTEYSSAFTIPSSVVEKHIKLSGATQLKVLLVALKNIAIGINPEAISNTLNMSIPDVIDALNYWVNLGVLLNEENKSIPQVKEAEYKPKKAVKAQVIKPSREEVIRRGAEDANIAFLLREAEFKFCRTLRPNESSSLLWLHDDQGIDISVILILISFAVMEGRATVSFIEKTAAAWIDSGVETVEDAEREINKYFENKNAWNSVRKITGIDKRQPTAKESAMVHKWFYEFMFDEAIIKLAYEKCADSTTKVIFGYMDKILIDWHKNGVKTKEDVAALEQKPVNTKPNEKMAVYDLDLYNDKLNQLPD